MGLREIFQTEASKFAFEKALPILRPVELGEIEDASLNRGKELDGTGRWAEAAQHFYTVARTSELSEERVESYVNLSQMLVNFGRFGQARGFLQKSEWVVAVLPEKERFYRGAQIEEKYGWISDYEGDFKDAQMRFLRAKKLLEEIPEGERGEREESLSSTITHFLGRAHIGLALQGKDVSENAAKAIHFFKTDLARFERLRQEGKPAPANEGFQHAWLGVCYLAANELSIAEEEIEKAGGLFREFLQTQPESGIMGHYHVLRGSLELRRDAIEEAREEFRKALRIREEKEDYPKGKADAQAGIAATYWREGRRKQAVAWFVKAVRTYPPTLVRTRTFIA